MLESGLFQLLSSNAGVAALCGSRLYPLVLPPDAALPSATYQLTSTEAEYTMDGPTGFIAARVQIDAWSDSYSDAKALSAAMRAVLDNYTGTLASGLPVLNVRCENASDGYEKDARLYRCTSSWLIQYAQQ